MRFVVKSDTHGMGFAIVMTLIVDFLLVFFGIQENTLMYSGVIALIITIFVAIYCIVSVNEKLIVDGDSLCYKSIRKKFYAVGDVKGLHIVKAQVIIGTPLRSWDLKNKYVIIYLKDSDFEWKRHQGSVDFWKYHRKHILFTTVYDERAIEYFKSKGISVTGGVQ